MMNIIALILIFFITSLSFAEEKVYTNEDLENYPSTTNEIEINNQENTPYLNKNDMKDAIIEKLENKVKAQQNEINALEKELEGPPKIIPGKECEVLD
jgi:hypothetical protein